MYSLHPHIIFLCELKKTLVYAFKNMCELTLAERFPKYHSRQREEKVALPTGFLYSQLCMFCSPHRNQSGIAHPLSNWFLAAPAALATCAQRDHPRGSHRSCRTRRQKYCFLQIFFILIHFNSVTPGVLVFVHSLWWCRFNSPFTCTPPANSIHAISF